jgi:hypothetical protein
MPSATDRADRELGDGNEISLGDTMTVTVPGHTLGGRYEVPRIRSIRSLRAA